MTSWIVQKESHASALAACLGLKRDMTATVFPLFKGEGHVLTVSGKGAARNAAALSRLLTLYPPEEGGVLIQLTFVAGQTSQQVALCHTIHDPCTNQTLYPDMPFNGKAYGFIETALENGPEEAAVFTAASCFLPIHRIITLVLRSEQDSRAHWLPLLEKVKDWAVEVSAVLQEATMGLSGEEAALLDCIAQNLHLSAAMSHQLLQQAKRCVGRKGACLPILLPFKDIISNDKTQRSQLYDHICKALEESYVFPLIH